MRGNPLARLSIRIEHDTLSELTALAKGEGITVSELIRYILNEYLEITA